MRRNLCLLLASFSLLACEGVGDITVTHPVMRDARSALDALPRARVAVYGGDGVPLFVDGDLGTTQPRIEEDLALDLGGLLPAIAPVFEIDARTLELVGIFHDAQGSSHVRYQQWQDGLEVIGGDLAVHIDRSGVIYAAHGTARLQTSHVTPELDATEATAVLAAELLGEGLSFGVPRLVHVLGDESASFHLAWEIVAKGLQDQLPVVDLVYVDAIRGRIVARHPQIHTARSRRVYDGRSRTYLPGTRVRSEGQDPTGDPIVDAAYENTGKAYDCFKALFGRDSYNGSGGTLTSTVHYGSGYNNAYWNGYQMVYGDGDGYTMRSFAYSLDVTTHELTHGITERTARLVYQGQPGALNEAMSDVLAAVCEAWDDGAVTSDTWKIGEDSHTPRIAGDALRYMDRPTDDGISYDWYPSRYTGAADNGGVHLNSGIANLAFKLTVSGGSHPRGRSSIDVPGLGMDRAGKIFYRALTRYMTSYMNFEGARAATAQAAIDLYGSAERDAVHAAWTAVGVPGAPTTPLPPPVGGTGRTALENGDVVTGLSGAVGTERHFELEVPAGATNLVFAIRGGTGDADLYVNRGAAPTQSVYGHRPYLQGNDERVDVEQPDADTWYAMVRGYSAFTNVRLTVTFQAAVDPSPPPSDAMMGNGETRENLGANEGEVLRFTLEVPAGARDLFFEMSGGTGDADLYVRFGDPPTTTTYDHRPYKNGNAESVAVRAPTAGTWHLMLHAYEAFSGASLRVNWSGSTPLEPAELSEQEPNDTAAGAQPIAGSATLVGRIGGLDDIDVFRLTATGVLTLGLVVPGGRDYDLALYDQNGQLVTRSEKPAGQAESLQVSAGTGTPYYVVVYGYNGDFDALADYELAFDW